MLFSTIDHIDQNTLSDISEFFVKKFKCDLENIDFRSFADTEEKDIINKFWEFSKEKYAEILTTDSISPYNEEGVWNTYEELIKEHIIFSVYYTLQAVAKEDIFYGKILDSVNRIRNPHQYPKTKSDKLINADCFVKNGLNDLNVVRDYISKNVDANPIIDHILNRDRKTNSFQTRGSIKIKHAYSNVIFQISNAWTNCPYNPKNISTFEPKQMNNIYNSFNTNICNLDLDQRLTECYLFENVFHFSFIKELLKVEKNFEEMLMLRQQCTNIYCDYSANEESEENKQEKEIYVWEKLTRRDREYFEYDDAEFMNIYEDGTFRIAEHLRQSKNNMDNQTAQDRIDFAKILKVLIRFYQLPNVFSRNTFLHVATANFFNNTYDNFRSWEKETMEFLDIISESVIPFYEVIFTYIIISYTNQALFNGTEKKNDCINVQKATELLKKHIEQHYGDNEKQINIEEKFNCDNKNKNFTNIAHDIYIQVMLNNTPTSSFEKLKSGNLEHYSKKSSIERHRINNSYNHFVETINFFGMNNEYVIKPPSKLEMIRSENVMNVRLVKPYRGVLKKNFRDYKHSTTKEKS